MEEDILQIFLDKLGKMPIAQNILINNKETTFEEIQAFFNRAILCKYNTLFVVEINSSFSAYQQRVMNIFINKLLTYKNKQFNENNKRREIDKSDTSSYMDSCLVFIYNKESESFLNELRYLKINELLLVKNHSGIRRTVTLDNLSNYSPAKDSFREHLSQNTYIVRSEICGLGKSAKIKNQIKEKGLQYFYLPLGGNITKNKVYDKLKNLMKKIPKDNNYKNIAIHLDLYETKDFSVLNEFLFSFLITKFYSNNENIIYIPTNIVIYVEIPNCFSDFMSNNKILKFFKRVDDMIKIDEIPDLNLPKNKIKLFKNMLGLSTNEEIFEWVKKHFKENIRMERYSYHQINMFINLFISQYNNFGGKKLSFKELNSKKDITEECIDSFAKGTQYFIYEGFSKLILDGKYNKETENDEIDLLSFGYENKNEKKNDLYNVTFDKKLIFIIKDKLIAYSLDLSNEALKNGKALGEQDNEEKQKREIWKLYYSSEEIKELEFLDILKKVLNLENPVEKKSMINEETNLISLLEIIERDKYVITIDNFRKMILILYRILANIPVILMGETGCGKTALIKKLNQLLNNGKLDLELLKIDSS